LHWVVHCASDIWILKRVGRWPAHRSVNGFSGGRRLIRCADNWFRVRPRRCPWIDAAIGEATSGSTRLRSFCEPIK
jgi:hypothetical protein